MIVRNATEEDLKVIVRFGVFEDWHAYRFDPTGFFVAELGGKVIGHINAVKYPRHSAYIGTFIVQKEHRGKGYGKKLWDAAWRPLDHRCTVALDGAPHMITNYESHGFRSVWNTSSALIDAKKVATTLTNLAIPKGTVVKPIKSVYFEKLFEYDTSVLFWCSTQSTS